MQRLLDSLEPPSGKGAPACASPPFSPRFQPRQGWPLQVAAVVYMVGDAGIEPATSSV